MNPPRWSLYGLVAAVAWVGVAGVGYHGWRQIQASASAPPPKTSVVVAAPSASPSPNESASPVATPAATPTPTPAPTPIPDSVLIKVPFTSQFPFQASNHAFYEDFCEAAGTLMAGAYWSGDQRAQIPGSEADTRMRAIVAYERASWPGQLNLSLADMGQSATHFFGLQSQIVPLDLNVIEQQLADGRPVIIPLMTHVNGAPINPGYGRLPVYHVLVLIGYDKAQGLVYTNDAGLYNGGHLPYRWSTLAAAADYAATLHVDGAGSAVPWQQGRVMLILSK
ncbi:MAG: C39 family peptidase [Candidatus Dormibacteraeota bacterium]|nr:C39 family peptidase [Candidatus Dormibacteraeota bacterium]